MQENISIGLRRALAEATIQSYSSGSDQPIYAKSQSRFMEKIKKGQSVNGGAHRLSPVSGGKEDSKKPAAIDWEIAGF